MSATPVIIQEPAPLLVEMQEPIQIVIRGALPSWNEILGMEHWARAKLKLEIQESFLCALRHSASDCSTRTTFARNTMLTAAATLDSYQATQREKRKLRQAKKKLAAQKTSELKS